MKFFKHIVVAFIFSLSWHASATLIELDESHLLNPLKIDSTFEEFYNYRGQYGLEPGQTRYKWSSHTGMEVSNQATFFFVEDMFGTLALFGLIDRPDDKKGGKLQIDFTTTSDNADDWGFVLVDDAGDARRTGSDLENDGDDSWALNFKWAKKFSDGFIFAGFNSDNFNLNLAFSNIKNVDDFVFMSFDPAPPAPLSFAAASLPSVSLFQTTGGLASLSAVAQVSEPAMWSLMLLAGAFAVSRRKYTLNS